MYYLSDNLKEDRPTHFIEAFNRLLHLLRHHLALYSIYFLSQVLRLNSKALLRQVRM
jgi:hypothetical protein